MFSTFQKSGLLVTTESSPDGSMVNVVAMLSPAVSKRTRLDKADD